MPSRLPKRSKPRMSKASLFHSPRPQARQQIKVRTDGTVKVLDFGLAKAMETASGRSSDALATSTDDHHTGRDARGHHSGHGSLHEPEQARGRPVDTRATSGRSAASCSRCSRAARVSRRRHHRHACGGRYADPDWSLLPADLPPTLLAFLKRCLQKDPKQRVGDIRDVRLALEGAFDAAAPQTAGAAPAVPRRHARESLRGGSPRSRRSSRWEPRSCTCARRVRPRRSCGSALSPPVETKSDRPHLPFDVTPDGQMIAFDGQWAQTVCHGYSSGASTSTARGRCRTRMASVSSVLGSRWPVARLLTRRAAV